MSRVVKHLGARSCPPDDSKVLMAVPFFPGEKIKSAQISGYFASGDDGSIDQPGECNWYGITIPWSLVFATELMNKGAAVGVLGDPTTIDRLYNSWLVQADSGETNAELWGGDSDQDTEDIAGEEGHDDEELLDSGPIGVHKWFSREVVMQPFAAEGNNVIRFGDSFSANPKGIPGAAMGGLLLFGMVRYKALAQTEFNVELDDVTSKEMMGLLIAGDYTKVQAKIEGDTSALGDYLRTTLFGGDNYVEADTFKGPAGKAMVKASFFIDSPISRKH